MGKRWRWGKKEDCWEYGEEVGLGFEAGEDGESRGEDEDDEGSLGADGGSFEKYTELEVRERVPLRETATPYYNEKQSSTSVNGQDTLMRWILTY